MNQLKLTCVGLLALTATASDAFAFGPPGGPPMGGPPWAAPQWAAVHPASRWAVVWRVSRAVAHRVSRAAARQVCREAVACQVCREAADPAAISRHPAPKEMLPGISRHAAPRQMSPAPGITDREMR